MPRKVYISYSSTAEYLLGLMILTEAKRYCDYEDSNSSAVPITLQCNT